MTTHDQFTEPTQPAQRQDPTSTVAEEQATQRLAPSDPALAREESLSVENERYAPPADRSIGNADTQMGQPGGISDAPLGTTDGVHESRGAAMPAAEPSSERSLFADDDLSGLRSRWNDVQAGFVDDPRACVQKADGLVSDVVDQLTNSFSAARARLEDQWARGEEASTEDLRLALKRYREFFEKLLAV